MYKYESIQFIDGSCQTTVAQGSGDTTTLSNPSVTSGDCDRTDAEKTEVPLDFLAMARGVDEFPLVLFLGDRFGVNLFSSLARHDEDLCRYALFKAFYKSRKCFIPESRSDAQRLYRWSGCRGKAGASMSPP